MVHRCKINIIKAQRALFLFLIFLRQVTLKHIVYARHQSPGDPERDDQLEEVVDDLDPAEDGEASEETHRPSYQTQLCLSCHLNISIKRGVETPKRSPPLRLVQSRHMSPCQRRYTQTPVVLAQSLQLEESRVFKSFDYNKLTQVLGVWAEQKILGNTTTFKFC